jgi:hypothetical protein
MLAGLGVVLARCGLASSRSRQRSYGQAYLMLARLSKIGRHRDQARRYLWRAIASDPRLLTRLLVLRSIVTMGAGSLLATAADV